MLFAEWLPAVRLISANNIPNCLSSHVNALNWLFFRDCPLADAQRLATMPDSRLE